MLNLIGAVEQRYPPASGVLCLGTLRQVRRYLRDPQLKEEVDKITAGAGPLARPFSSGTHWVRLSPMNSSVSIPVTPSSCC